MCGNYRDKEGEAVQFYFGGSSTRTEKYAVHQKEIPIPLSSQEVPDNDHSGSVVRSNPEMAGKGAGQGESSSKLDGQIACIKYTLFCFNIMSWVGAVTVIPGRVM